MKILTSFLIIMMFLGSCSNYNKDEINDFIFSESFLLINEKQDTILIEFSENCVRNYSWNYLINREWNVSDHNDEIILNFDGESHKLKSKIENEMVFTNNDTHFRLIKVNQQRINLQNLIGKWIESDYYFLLSNNNLPQPPPCPNFESDTLLIPGIKFNGDSAFINDFCYKQNRVYKINQSFGFINFGEHCFSSLNQWQIIELTKDTMIVNKMYYENGEIRHETYKTYVKHGS